MEKVAYECTLYFKHNDRYKVYLDTVHAYSPDSAIEFICSRRDVLELFDKGYILYEVYLRLSDVSE